MLSVLMKKQTYLHLGRLEGKYILAKLFVFSHGWITLPQCFVNVTVFFAYGNIPFRPLDVNNVILLDQCDRALVKSYM